MELIDNKNLKLKDDLASELKSSSKMSVAAACFSIYAFQELKKELKNIDELRFIFTLPSFTTENVPMERREFYIPRMNRERSLYGTEFEVKLRNELTQKAIAKECADWIRQKVRFKSNITDEKMMGFINVNDKNYMPVDGFTTVDLGCERGNNAYSMIQKTDMPFSKAYIDLFDELWRDKNRLQDVTDIVLDNITAAYNENSPEFIYFIALYNIFNYLRRCPRCRRYGTCLRKQPRLEGRTLPGRMGHVRQHGRTYPKQENGSEGRCCYCVLGWQISGNKGYDPKRKSGRFALYHNQYLKPTSFYKYV